MVYRLTLSIFALAAASPAVGQAPNQTLISILPDGSGLFGQAVELSGSTLAIGSNEWDVLQTGRGRVLVYERSPTGTWEYQQELTRQPHFSPGSACGECFGHGIEIVGDSMMVKGDYHTTNCWEFQRTGGSWSPHEQIGSLGSLDPLWRGVGGMDYDGETLLTGYPAALGPQGQIDPMVRFWERQGSWTTIRTFRASDVGIEGLLPSLEWGSVVDVNGDHAVVSAHAAEQGGIIGVGLVKTFRRVNGVWEYEQTLQRPDPPAREHNYGLALAIDDDWLFVSCFWDVERIGAVYVYRRSPSETWEFHSKIHPTANEGTNLRSCGFGIGLQWVPPTLAVTSANYRVPALSPNTSTGGAGSILLYQLCNGIWDQRIGLTAPLGFGPGGLGLFREGLSFDGNGIAAGAPYSSFNTGVFQTGAVATIDFVLPPPTPCLEIGRPACMPYEPETLDCPCGAVAAPGLGCPNAAGPGARLHLHGYYNEAELQRAVVDGLSPDSLVLLLVGQPVPSLLPAGQVAGDGVLCLTPTVARAVARAGATGTVTFEHIAVQPPLLFFYGVVGYELPVQAIYRAPVPGPCNARWNTTNAILLTISTLNS